MFGDKTLIGQGEINLDHKSRVFIPAKTGREENDVLALMYDNDIECYRLYNVTTLEKTFREYEKLILEAKTNEEQVMYKKRALEFYKSIVKECIVDAQGRTSFKDCFEANTKVETIGAGDHLILKSKSK